MADQGFDVPALNIRIRVAPHLTFHWSAFSDLSTDRQLGMGLGPIPWTAIERYAARYRIEDPDEFDRFAHLIGVMDRAFLSWHAEQKG